MLRKRCFMTQKGILAFSGGLDTSVVVKYLQEEHDMDVITVTVDVGQGDDAKKIAAKAKKLGVKKHYNIDARKEFVDDYIFPAIKANALYQKKYCLATALARPLIAEKVLEIAKKEKVTSLAHGCSGKGNDQVRFDITLRSGSDLPIIAPIRDKNLDRDTELKFANKHGIEIDSVAKKFSIDQNLWGRAIEGGVLEDPYNEPPDDAFIWVKTKDLPDKPTYLEIKFEKGIPVEVDKKIKGSQKIIEYINKKAGAAGVGIVDHIEDRVVGIKSREVYETPAATCLIEAHADLEKMVHTKHENKFKSIPDHDLLVGGFPCQDYSVAKPLSNSKGLVGEKGVLWWSIYNILRKKGAKKPKYLFLENVDRLLLSGGNQKGKDFAVILSCLYKLGYAVEWRVINAADYGMPQRRRRVYLAYKS